MRALWRYFDRCGVEFDIAVNVLTGGELGQTVSYRAAVAQRDGKRWGCIFCWFLNYAVQRNHCPLQFVKQPANLASFIRAGVAFGVGAAAAAMTVEGAWHLISIAFGAV